MNSLMYIFVTCVILQYYVLDTNLEQLALDPSFVRSFAYLIENPTFHP